MNATPLQRATFAGRRAAGVRRAMAGCAALLLTAAAAAGWTADAEDHPDAKFLRGLRSRQLFSLAERYCEAELRQQTLPPRRRADLSEELIRTLAQHAAYKAPSQRAALWDRVAEVAERLPRDTPRWLLVQTQAALAALARAELARQEADAASDTARETALRAVRDAQRRLEQLDKTLEREIPLRRRSPPDNAEALTGDELFALRMQIQFHLATAFYTRARVYPRGDVDQLAALQSALQWCDKPLSQLSPDEPLVRKIHLLQASCQRLLGKMPESKRLLESLLAGVEPQLRRRALAELARWELDQGKPDRALAVLNVLPAGASAEADLARLEALLAMLRRAKSADPASADPWRDRAVAAVKQIRRQHGSYWGRRADQLLVAAAGSLPAGGDLEIMRRQADDLAQRKEYAAALAAYDKAAEQAQKSGDEPLAFELRYKAALVEQQLGRPERQAERLRKLAVSLPRHADAAKTHFHAIILTVRLAREDAEQLAAYQAMLPEHVELWPQSPHAPQVLRWHGIVLEQRGEWPEAAAAYRASAELAPTPEAVAGFERATRRRLASQASARDPAQQACRWLESLILEDNRLPARWTPARRAAALSAARLYLRFVPNAFSRVESLVQGALRGPPAADAEVAAEAAPLLIVALAAQPDKRQQAGAWMERLQAGSTDQLLTALDGLTRAIKAVPEASRQATAELQLQTIAVMQQRADLDDATRDRMLQAKAEALAAAGRASDAIEACRTLVERRPRDGAVQIAMARFLSTLADDSPEAAQAALEQWRRVGARLRPGGDAWYEAKYEVARQLLALEKPAEARKRLEYVQAVRGFPGQPAWEQRYQQLLERCR